MSFFDRAIERVRGVREFPLGEAGMPPGMIGSPLAPTGWIDQYAPEEYANYAAQSNPVYSVISNKALYLTMLPLRAYRVTGPLSAPGEGRDGEWSAVVAELRRRERASQRPRNLGLSLSQRHDALERARYQRVLGIEEVYIGQVSDLLNYVNPHWSPHKLWWMSMVSMSLYGDCYWIINRGESGLATPREIWWAPPQQMTPEVHPTEYVSGYWYEGASGEPVFFPATEVVRMYYPHPKNQWAALSPLAAARLYADHEQASMKGNMNLHRQGLQPGAIVTPKGRIRWSPEQAKAVEEDINARLRGVDRAHRWAVFRHEVDIHTSGISPNDSAFLEGMQYDVERVANAYKWPIDLVSGKRTYENINQAHKAAWTVISAEAGYMAAEITEQLLPMFTRSRVDFLAFDTSDIAVMQEDEAARWERERTQIDLVVTRNEWRESQARAPVENGDKLYVDASKVPLERVGENVQPAPVQPEANETVIPDGLGADVED